jgi:hypothetical protein
VDHLGAMFNSNLDDLVTSQISTDWGVLAALSNDICLVSLCKSEKLAH